MANWFMADPHFDEESIISYCGRPFRTAKQMNKTIIRNCQAVINDDDDFYLLGDISMRGSQYKHFYELILQQLPGHKHLILGNHDTLNPFLYEEIGFMSVHTKLKLNEYILIHDPAAACCIDQNLKWICGHIHNIFKVHKNIVNVGVDVWDFKPVSEFQIEFEFLTGGKNEKISNS